MTLTEKRRIVETLRTDYSMRQICDALGFNRSSLYYEPKMDPCEALLKQEIEMLAARSPRYGYRRITEELLRLGYTVGYRRVARLMKSANLLVSVKPQNPLRVSLNGSTDLITLTSVDAFRFG